jgi:hypothetical protein
MAQRGFDMGELVVSSNIATVIIDRGETRMLGLAMLDETGVVVASSIVGCPAYDYTDRYFGYLVKFTSTQWDSIPVILHDDGELYLRNYGSADFRRAVDTMERGYSVRWLPGENTSSTGMSQ